MKPEAYREVPFDCPLIKDLCYADIDCKTCDRFKDLSMPVSSTPQKDLSANSLHCANRLRELATLCETGSVESFNLYESHYHTCIDVYERGYKNYEMSILH